MSDIISKWVVNHKGWVIAITEDRQVYDVATESKMLEYWNNGSISFRIKGSTKRIGKATINRLAQRKSITIKPFCPF
jgi:hypothetical protein